MAKFIIVTDSCSDLTGEVRQKYDIEYFPMLLNKDGQEFEANLDWTFMNPHEFYASMKDGSRYRTSQVPIPTFQNGFENWLKQGLDVLYISCSSALSASYNSACLLSQEILKNYPDRKIICVDSLSACMGEGLLCVSASKMRAEGKTIDEVAEYLNAHKLEMHQWATCDSLEYLKRAGRVSATSAFFGGLLQVKPIIISDVNGCNVSSEKTKGRKTSLKLLIDRFMEHYQPDHPYQCIAVSHCDIPEEMEAFKAELLSHVENKDIEVLTQDIGPIIGATLGPGGIAIFFWGDTVTYDSKAGK